MTEDELVDAVAVILSGMTGLTVRASPGDPLVRSEAVRAVALVRSVPARRHAGPCVHSLTSSSGRPTFLYFRDGSKVVLRRDGAAAWLDVVPQAVISVQDVPDDS